MGTIIIALLVLAGLTGIVLLYEAYFFQYNKARTLRTCRQCGSSQRLMEGVWVYNKSCKKCKI